MPDPAHLVLLNQALVLVVLYFDDLQCSFVLLQQSMQTAPMILSVSRKALDQPEHDLIGITKEKGCTCKCAPPVSFI